MYFHCYSNGLHLIECNVTQFAFIETLADNMKDYSAKADQGCYKSKRLLQLGVHQKVNLEPLLGLNCKKNCSVIP